MKKLRRNAAALIAFVIIVFSAFVFPLFNFNLLGQGFSDKTGVMANLITELLSGGTKITESHGVAILAMIVVYLIIALFYLLNGLGMIYNRYSRYASMLSIVYLFLGLFVVLTINNKSSVPFFGTTLASVSLGIGTYLVTLVGVGYLIFKRVINRAIRL